MSPKPKPTHKLGNPIFRWEIEDDCLAVIKSQYEFAKKLADSVDMYILPFGLEHQAQGMGHMNGFGKRLIKTFKVSPDAYVQLALQLANYRDQVHIEGIVLRSKTLGIIKCRRKIK